MIVSVSTIAILAALYIGLRLVRAMESIARVVTCMHATVVAAAQDDDEEEDEDPDPEDDGEPIPEDDASKRPVLTVVADRKVA